MNILMWIFVIVCGLVGIVITLFLTLSIPVVIIWKLYRKVKYHIGMYD